MTCARARYNEEISLLPWFRRKKSKIEQEAHESATTDAPVQAEPAQVDEPAPEAGVDEPGDGSEAPKKKRRRGSRGERRARPAGQRRARARSAARRVVGIEAH